MKKFDLKKMIAENKATFFTSLSENKKQYYKDAEADDAEHIEALEKDMKDDKKASKMTKEELKAKIKEMALAEMDVNIKDETNMYDPVMETELEEASIDAIDRMDGLVSQNYLSMMFRAASGIIRDLKNENFEEDDIHDYLVYLITTLDDSALMSKPKEMPGFEGTRDALDSLSIREEEEEEEVEAEEEVDVDVEDPEPAKDGGISVTQNADAELTGAEKETQDNLEAALEAAKKLGDQKLVDQIGNSITFFTRQHVVKEDLNESAFPILKKILK